MKCFAVLTARLVGQTEGEFCWGMNYPGCALAGLTDMSSFLWGSAAVKRVSILLASTSCREVNGLFVRNTLK